MGFEGDANGPRVPAATQTGTKLAAGYGKIAGHFAVGSPLVEFLCVERPCFCRSTDCLANRPAFAGPHTVLRQLLGLAFRARGTLGPINSIDILGLIQFANQTPNAGLDHPSVSKKKDHRVVFNFDEQRLSAPFFGRGWGRNVVDMSVCLLRPSIESICRTLPLTILSIKTKQGPAAI